MIKLTLLKNGISNCRIKEKRRFCSTIIVGIGLLLLFFGLVEITPERNLKENFLIIFFLTLSFIK